MPKTLIEIDRETGWASKTTVAELAQAAGSKAAIAKACGVSLRTVGNWRSGETDKVSFRAVFTMAAMTGVSLDDVQP